MVKSPRSQYQLFEEVESLSVKGVCFPHVILTIFFVFTCCLSDGDLLKVFLFFMFSWSSFEKLSMYSFLFFFEFGAVLEEVQADADG
jgi:hypothetical protein